jgi:hypothetical protein
MTKVNLNEIPEEMEKVIFSKGPIKIVMTVYLRHPHDISFSAYIEDKYVMMSRSERLGTTVRVLNKALEFREYHSNVK